MMHLLHLDLKVYLQDRAIMRLQEVILQVRIHHQEAILLHTVRVKEVHLLRQALEALRVHPVDQEEVHQELLDKLCCIA